MDLRAAIAEQLVTGRRIIAAGHTVVPAWRIGTPDGTFLILTRFDEAKPEQCERALALVGRFMAWKLAMAFVFMAEGTGRDELSAEHNYLMAAGISRREAIVVRQRIHRTATPAEPSRSFTDFGSPETFTGWDTIDPLLLTLLPRGPVTVDEAEALLLASLFGEGGEMPAHRLN
jgi:hypothetical protein